MKTKPNADTREAAPATTPKAAVERRSITDEILALRPMPTPDLVDRYEDLFGKPPRSKNRDHLWRRIAWKLQEQRFGGLSQVARRRLDELIGELDLPLAGDGTVRGSLSHSSKPRQPITGTTLVREWRGKQIRATSVDGGWENDGVVYRSLSALVKSITGTHASGPAWFGIVKAKEA